jgi:hypothetical protein
MGEEKSKDDGIPFGTIHQAASRGRLEPIKVLLESGANPDQVDERGWGPLHFAADKGHWNIARLLLEKGATPGLINGSGMTPLDYVVSGGYLELVRLLLECDALLADRFTGKSTPPTPCCNYARRHTHDPAVTVCKVNHSRQGEGAFQVRDSLTEPVLWEKPLWGDDLLTQAMSRDQVIFGGSVGGNTALAMLLQ